MSGLPDAAPSARRHWTWLAAVAWLGCAALGLFALLAYAGTPGPVAGAPARWPSPASALAPGLALDPARPTLVVFAHPRCPCTRASLRELERLAAHARERLAIRVLFFAPRDAEPGFEQGALHAIALGIPGARVATDPGGELARLFGATTSGHAALFAPDGALAFHGGLTTARGHEGRSPGRDAIQAFVETGAAPAAETPVFGCALFEPEAAR